MRSLKNVVATIIPLALLVGCGGQEAQISRIKQAVGPCGDPPDMLIVLDKSGSMQSFNKWTDATTAVNTVVSTFTGQIRFGLELFPYGPGYCDVATSPQVPVGDDTASAISSQLAAITTPTGNTPMTLALERAQDYLTGIDPGKTKYVLLITDGQPTCAPTNPLPVVTALAAAGIQTYVVGFGDGVNPTMLDNMAAAGGTTSSYLATNQAALQAALADIASAITCCGNGVIDTGEECDDGNQVDGDGCSAACLLENFPPVAQCQDVTVPADAQCVACVSVDNGSYDPDGNLDTVTEAPGCDYGLGATLVTLTATDTFGLSDSCTATVTVEDTTPPVVSCNALPTITPPDAPISFVAGVTDNCGASVVVTGYDCWAINGAGKKIDKKRSCVVSFSGDTLSILDSGGVGDHITWTIEATDTSGNTATGSCEVEVLNPGRP